VRTVNREGRFYRVVSPSWIDPLDTSFSKQYGGRWNAPEAFGVLYLNADVKVAAANARANHARRAIQLFDLNEDARPALVEVALSPSQMLDIASPEGIAANGLPATYPCWVGHAECQPIGQSAYDYGLDGVACLSSAECTPTSVVGEELGVFDRVVASRVKRRRTRSFARWYPDAVPPEN
jgi:RES domain-containing protein